MKTTSLLKFSPFAPFSDSSANFASISRYATEALERLAGSSLSPILEIQVETAQLERARDSSAQHGDAEVLSTSGLFLICADGHQHPVDLAIQCKSTGPILVTTYDEWMNQD